MSDCGIITSATYNIRAEIERTDEYDVLVRDDIDETSTNRTTEDDGQEARHYLEDID